MLSRESFGIYGDAAWKEREKARKRREYTIQAVLILILVGFLAAVSMNVADNLAERHINSGFAFLGHPPRFHSVTSVLSSAIPPDSTSVRR